MSAHDLDALRRVLTENGASCEGIATRNGVDDECGKPATTIIDARECEDGCYWPACTFHAYRHGRRDVVPLPTIVEALGAPR